MRAAFVHQVIEGNLLALALTLWDDVMAFRTYSLKPHTIVGLLKVLFDLAVGMWLV